MATSLALNWNLPASTPLFDDDSPLTSTDDAPTQQAKVTSGPSTSASRAPHSVDNTQLPRSYAAAASNHRATSSTSQVPASNFAAVGLSGQPNYGFKTPSYNSGFSTLPGGPQMMVPQAVVTEDGRRIRTTSGPQRPTHLTYNDTLHSYPGLPTMASLNNGRSHLPPGAMQPAGLSHATSSPALSTASNGYHPYRRTNKVSEPYNPNQQPYASAIGATNGGAPSLPQIQAVQLPQKPPRARSASSTSAMDTSSGASSASRQQAPSSATTYSSILSANATNRLPHTQSPSSISSSSPKNAAFPAHQPSSYLAPRPAAPLRQDSASSIDAGSLRTADAAASTESFATAGSNSSQTSLQNVDRQATLSSPLSNGRTTPVARKPHSSPLSRQASAVADDDGVANSDDENTIGGRTTPTPGDKQKKSLSGKLRKALSLSTLQQVEAAAAAPDRAYGGRTNVATKRSDGSPFPHSSAETNGSSGSTRSTSPPRTPDNGVPLLGSSAASIASRRSTRPPISGAEGGTKRSIFNRKFNSSTDNISISSTVSSASMMLRKVGNLGKLAKRSNIMGLTNMFNRDKENGRAGLHSDDFGTLPVSSDREAPDGSSADTAGKSKMKKGALAQASVSHATVELERTADSGIGDANMTPAASYVRQHQLQMRAEAERLAREKAEAERVAMSNKAKSKTMEDGVEGRQKMIEKEKERLKSKRGWRKRLVGSLGSASDAQQMTGLEVVPLDETAKQHSHDHVGPPGAFHVSQAGAGVPGAQPQLGNPAIHYNDSSLDSSFTDEDFEPPHMPGANGGYESNDDVETDSLRHWGEGIERSRESAAKIKNVKGILKSSASYNELSASSQAGAFGAVDKPFAGRLRANSYDAPQATSQAPSTVPLMSQIASGASTDRVDGVSRPSEDVTFEQDTADAARAGASTPTQSITHGSSIGHHANSSMPTLSLMMNPSARPLQHDQSALPMTRKRLVFADTQIYHSTWPAHVYDRRGELATCNRLTPLLAQRIKEELNTYKMEEMAVAPSSRIHTHFFV